MSSIRGLAAGEDQQSRKHSVFFTSVPQPHAERGEKEKTEVIFTEEEEEENRAREKGLVVVEVVRGGAKVSVVCGSEREGEKLDD